jgi:hypothetical protein
VAALERALVDRPAGDAVTVVNLLSSRRRCASGSIADDVVNEIGIPGQVERTARSAAAQASAASVSMPSAS